MHSLAHYLTAFVLFVLCEKLSLLAILFHQKWLLPPTHEKEPKELWLNMLVQMMSTTMVANLTDGLLGTMRALKSITSCIVERSSLLPRC